ncbi:MAG: hypothetical protein GTO02_16155 [Candidatus Dadabacteria bacterium]|nr:hypothetical protein [Candidatus Dadabacteria bacterium]
MIRPKCKRCGGSLDIFFDPETDRQEWTCNNPHMIYTDEEFEEKWNRLNGDEVVRLKLEMNID